MKIMYKIRIVMLFLLLSVLSANNILKSMFVPGLGEKSLGEDSRAKIFMCSEMAILGTYFLGKSFNKYYIDNYSGFAELHAGADMENKSYSFVVNMSNYNSMIEFNEDMMRHHNEDDFDDVYDVESNYYWEWDSTDNRYKFNDMRESSIIAQKFAEFSIAGLVINRIISIIDVVYLEKKKSNVDLSVFVLPEGNDAISINVSFSLK